MGFAGALYDVGFVIIYGFIWIVFPKVSLSFTIFLCEVYGSRERDRPLLMPGYISGAFHFWSIACMTSSRYYMQFNKCICNLTSDYSFNCGF